MVDIAAEVPVVGPVTLAVALMVARSKDTKHNYRKSRRNHIERQAGKSWHKLCKHEHMERYCKTCKTQTSAALINTQPHPSPTLEYMQEQYPLETFRKSRMDGQVQLLVGVDRYFAVCGHKKAHRKCEYCGGEDLCEKHRIQKDRCGECHEELAYCPCGKRWELCLECNGSALCPNHPTIPKGNCIPCGGYKLCKTCKNALAKVEGVCTTCHPDFIPTPVGASKEACLWLTLVNQALGPDVTMQRIYFDANASPPQWSGREKRIPGWRAKAVDGFHVDPHTGEEIVHEYFGEDVHGHPHGWIGNEEAVDRFGRNRKARFNDTQNKMRKLKLMGYRVFYVWCVDFKNRNPKEDILAQRREFIDKLEW